MARIEDATLDPQFDKAIEAVIRNDYELARVLLQNATGLNPESPEIHAWLGEVQRNLNEFSAGVQSLTKAIQISQNWAAPYYCRSLCYDSLRDHNSAAADRRVAFRYSDKPYLEIPGRFRPCLLTIPLLQQAREIGINPETVLGRIESLPGTEMFTYPNGTIQVAGDAAFNAVRTEIISPVESQELARAHRDDPARMQMLLGGASYASIAPFPAKLYNIVLWGDAVKHIENNNVVVMTGRITEPGKALNFCELDDIPVLVAYKRRFNASSRDELGRILSKCFDTTSDPNVFGEGPIIPTSKDFEFFPRIVRFSIDARRSGQHSINWLILSLIDAMPGNLPTEIFFTDQPSHAPAFVRSFEELYDMHHGYRKPIEVDLDQPQPLLSETNWNNKELTVVPNDCEAPDVASYAEGNASIICSEYFAIEEGVITPENLLVTIVLCQRPPVGYHDPFSDSIRHWLNLGSLGAFDGGFDSYSELNFDETGHQAELRCDMGSADCKLALSSLVKILETWHVNGVGIEKLVVSSYG